MIIKSAEFVTSAVDPKGYPIELSADVAFAGRSNVGKSSLMNALLDRRKLVKTSQTPGKTRQINYFRINNSFYFVDLPGYGYAKVSKTEREKWRPMMEDYFDSGRRMAATVLLVDARRGASELDLAMIEMLKQRGIVSIIAVTKTDKLSKTEAAKAILQAERDFGLGAGEVFSCSAVKKTGTEALMARLVELIFPLGAP